MSKPKRLPPFKPELRQAIREGRKTQTRRVFKDKISADCVRVDYCAEVDKWYQMYHDSALGRLHPKSWGHKCPYGKPGDMRFLIEPLNSYNTGTGIYAAYSDTGGPVLIDEKFMPWKWSKPYLTSIHMPTVAARTFVRLTDVRVERVQDITEEDAIEEGTDRAPMVIAEDCEKTYYGPGSYVEGFAHLWDSINAKRGYSWDSNPWVWVIEWELLEGRP